MASIRTQTGDAMRTRLGDIGYFEEAPGAPMDSFVAQVDGFLERFGLAHYSFVQLNTSVTTPDHGDLNLHTNYDDAWIERYTGRRYDQLDPVCQLGRRNAAPFMWGGRRFLSDFEKRQRRVFWEAEDFGIVFGVSIPMRAVDGSVGLVSFTSENRTALADVMASSGPVLFTAAHQISDRLIRRDLSKDDEENPLSPRERESLIWVVEGMTSEEIADRMLLSVSAVNYHLGRATRKLSARNRHHAALLALSRRLI